MKKIGILLISLVFLLTGCFKENKNDVVKDLTNNINKLKSYKLVGNMEISNDEEKFVYSIDISYLKDNYYKVLLVNQTNNHEQIILKNNDNVYVITPELNKSFKFQSEWPDNSSQAYLLKSLVNDITKDKDCDVEIKDNGYVIKSKVNYPNNEELKYQKVYLKSNKDIERVEVYNDKDIVKIKVNITSLEKNPSIKDSDFKLENFVKEEDKNKNKVDNKVEENNKNTTDQNKTNENVNNNPNQNSNNTETNNTQTTENNGTNQTTENNNCSGSGCDNNKRTANIDNIIYPLYIPSNTYLTSSEKVETTFGNRVILTFGGEKNFVLIEEATIKNDSMEIVPVYGEPVMLTEVVGALSANSLTWDKGNISYYLASTELSINEMSLIANSLGNNTLVANTK